MDREAAVIRAEMSHTREKLDRKVALLQARVHEMSPRRLSERYVPDYLVDRMIGGILTLIGVRMAWSLYRGGRRSRRARVHAALESYGRW
jgi:hypothetical protein